MGIRGLSSYITQRKHKFMENFELHDTYLVIDGYCIMSQIYYTNKCNYYFGGDYLKFSILTAEFFDSLLKCNIRPLIIIDGAMEDKKLNTLLDRAQIRLTRVSMSEPTNQLSLIPFLIDNVFQYIVRNRNIKIVQASFEADDHIASIAKILNCPVLSFDSDFFIYDVLYIPYNTLQQGVFRNRNGHGFVKRCKIFKSNLFVQNFDSLKKEVLPLASVLLGNDYISINVFKNFLSSLKIKKELKKEFGRNKLHLRIESVLRWLQKQSLDTAITNVLLKLDPEKHESIIEVIEMIINGYSSIQTSMLDSLGFSPDHIDKMIQKVPNKIYKYTKQRNFIEPVAQINDDESYLSWDEDLTNSSSPEEFVMKPVTIHNLDNMDLSWFMQGHNAAYYPSYFLDMINRQLLLVIEQLEDYNYSTCINISLKIISVIFRILSNGTTDCCTLKYIARGEGPNIKEYELNCSDYVIECEIPPLQKLQSLTVNDRRKIFTSAVGISADIAVKFPKSWRLYVVSIKYWLREAEEIFTTNYHLTTLVFCIIYHVIKKIIDSGPYLGKNQRNANNYEKYEAMQGFILESMPIRDALERVTFDDCLSAEHFYKGFFNIQFKEEFNKTTIHAFSLFQNCLNYIMDLNSLLGCPYDPINVADFFPSGILIYNLFHYFKDFSNLNEQVKDIFRNSPNISQLVFSVMTQIKEL